MDHTAERDIRETGDLTRLMMQFAIPTVVSLLVGALYNIVDQIFIANAPYLGSYGNAANTVVYPLTVIALAIATMFGNGESAFFSMALGRGDRDTAARSLGTTMSSVCAVSVIVALIYFIFRDRLVTLLGGTVNPYTFAYAGEYLIWLIPGIPFYMFGQSMAASVNADGCPRYSMCCTLAGALTNTIFDPIFIYIFRWGMMGAALATIMGQILVAVLFALYIPRFKNVSLRREDLRIDPHFLRQTIPLGLNTFFAQFAIVLSMACFNNLERIYGALDPIFSMAEYSQIPTAVVGIVMKFFQIVVSVAIGIATGSIPILGYNVGARRIDRVMGMLRRMLIAEAVVGTIAFMVFEFGTEGLVALFGSSGESIYYKEFALRAIRIFLGLITLSCINKCIALFMQAVGRAREAVIISLWREVICGVGLPILLCRYMGLDGLLYSMPAAEFLTVFLAVPLLIQVCRAVGQPEPGSTLRMPPRP